MQAGPQRAGEESRTILEKNPVKLEENSSGEKSGENGESFLFYITGEWLGRATSSSVLRRLAL